jgi:predicted nucleic acid-binding protein
MILVDATVVIDYLRTADPKLDGLFRTLPVAICGITRAEVLCGSRNPRHRQDLLTLLNSFGQVVIPDALWDEVGDNLAALRRAGVTVPFPDSVIATVALKYDIELWARDRHFFDIQKVLHQLKLFHEPP